LKFNLIIVSDYMSHVIVNGVVTFWLIPTIEN
jgi:hypothetical protein